MGVRNCAEVGENLQKIMSRLLANDNLVNLLYYSDKDPYSGTPLTSEQKSSEVFENLIKIVPRVGPRDDSKSFIVITVMKGSLNSENSEFRNTQIRVEVFVPITEWIIKDTNLRPFAILGEVQKSLNNKTINGLGKMQGGDYELSFLSEEMSCYAQYYSLVSYD
jgi:hypothetical protein